MVSKTRELVSTGLLIAMGVILTRFASIRVSFGGIEGIRIGVGTLPIMLAGILFGPLFGSLTGALVDIIGYMLNPMGPYMPHFTLTSALYGCIPGCMVLRTFYSRIEYRFSPVFMIWTTIAVTQIVIGLFLTPFFLHVLFGIPWKILIIPRIISIPIQIVLYRYVFQLLFKAPSFHSVFNNIHQPR